MTQKIKQILIFGLYLGLISIALSVIVYVFDLAFISMFSGFLIGIFGLILNIFLLVYFGRKIRTDFHFGFIPYGKAFGNAILMVLIMSVITFTYNYTFYKWIAPDYLTDSKIIMAERMEQNLYDKGLAEKDIEVITDKILEQPVKSAIITSLFGLIGSVVFGVVYSLIAAAMIKKNPNPFEEIQDEELPIIDDSESNTNIDV